MRIPNYYDEEALARLLKGQKKRAWDLNHSISWQCGIDSSKPLVPLDDHNIAFPGKITKAERLAVSQFMGLMIASTFSATEHTLGRLREEAWERFVRRYAVSPEVIALGEEFFEEEAKHAGAFERYIAMFAGQVGVTPAELRSILPTVGPGRIESWFRRNARKNGLSLWWMVATVEEESLLIFRQMVPFRGQLDPLYYELHKRHFEEEARHAPYAHVFLNMCEGQEGGIVGKWRRAGDFLASEIAKILWLIGELTKVRGVKKFCHRHVFFATLEGLLGRLRTRQLPGLFWRFLFQTPYISPFLNPNYHPELSRRLKTGRNLRLPLPKPRPVVLAW